MQNFEEFVEQGSSRLTLKVERQRLHDVVVEHLRSFITEGVLAPGKKLNERELCETLGISRTPLREALKVLAVEGLIEINPNRGATVAKMSELEIRETFELMSGIEAFAGELACERITAEELDEIKALHYAMVVSKNQNDLPGYYQRNRAIHDLINQAARNDALRQVYLSLNRRIQALRFLSNQQAPKWERALHDHEEMIEALETRDGRRLSGILRHHLLEKRDAIMLMVRDEAEHPDSIRR
ncbi:GntR family transcriptional regulator [Pseudomonas sp. NPDC090202]|uniref:GntR family transcriptional regulator n=1 Tax=unclassified Pseudomonas TaxID=196821 RepID=UPI003811F2E4